MNEDIILIGSENLVKIVETLQIYVNEENSLIEDIKERYEQIDDNYISDNSNQLGQLVTENNLNLNKMKYNHDSNIFIINARIEHVRKSVRKSQEINNRETDGIV